MRLEQIYEQIWSYLADSVNKENQAIPTMQAATVGLDGAPTVCTVALRYVTEPDNLITFHTDVRSPKVSELDREPRIALIGVDARRNRARAIRSWGRWVAPKADVDRSVKA